MNSSAIVVRRRLDSDYIAELRREVRRGSLVSVLPGVYVPTHRAHDPRYLAAAATHWRADAVVSHEVAAHLTFWPELLPKTVTVAARARFSRPGYTFQRRMVSAEMTRMEHGIRITDPHLTTLDLLDSFDTDAIDRALRSRQVSLDGLWQALRATRSRRGNYVKARALLDSRDEPWSAAERLAHRKFRKAGLTGWRSNYPVWCRGRQYFLDLAFPEHKLAVEIDGRLHEDDPDQFERDRWRQNNLILAGWTVLRFTWDMLVNHFDHCLRTIKNALAQLAA